MKEYLELLRERYETEVFIKNDPVQFPHLFSGDIKNLETMGFISSVFAFGKREVFISKLNLLLDIMEYKPYEFVLNFEKNENRLNGFNYRFYKDYDIKAFFKILSSLYKENATLGDFFFENKSKNTIEMIQKLHDFFCNPKYNPKTQGFSFMISNPKKGGANKRMNMFLRWMTRSGPVDFGVWDFIDKSDLIIPLDVHSGRIARELNLLKRKQNDCIAALELTEKLKEFDPGDPVKYDFALFGAGVNKDINLRVLS